MSGKHKPRPLPSLRVDRRDQGFGDGDTPHVAEVRMREAEQAFAMKYRARELRAKAAELRSQVVVASDDLLAGLPPDQWLARAESVTPQPAADMLLLIDAMELELEAIEADECAATILAGVTARIAHAYDLAGRVEKAGAKRDKKHKERGALTQSNFDRAVAYLAKKGEEVTTASVRRRWPADAKPISDSHIRTLIANWKNGRN